jgi:hypothetical protein
VERLSQYAAVALFLARAREARPDFQVTTATAAAVLGICARLDGLPLALELAAARLKLLPPAVLLNRLERRLPLLVGGARDLEARQQTMHATLAWSEDLLQPEEQRLFRRLSVFVGGFTLEAAEAVCAAPEGAEPLGVDLLEGLERLVDQSLVLQQTVEQEGAEEEREEGSEARFRLLYVIREYALEQLEACGEAEALRQAHLAHYLGLVEERALAVFGPQGAAWLGRLEREHDNFRAALAWTRERSEVELGLRLAASLGPFWFMRGYLTEGRGWVEGLLALVVRRAEAGSDGSEGASGGLAVARAKALDAASNFAMVQGDDERALAAAEEALALALACGQQAGWATGAALYVLGALALDRGDLERATAYLEESVARLRAAGEPWLAATYLNYVGALALDRGDLERATAWYEESLAFARRMGADYLAGFALDGLADVARLRGDLAGAEALGREQLQVWRRLSSPMQIAASLENLACTTVATGEGAQTERAAHLLGAAAALRERVGASPPRRLHALIERAAAPARAALGEERWAAAFAAGRALSLEEAIAEALGEKSSG